ncbi:MAG: hypothetical protein F6K14_07110 [Symploca sp. SIO2C1]|nr:hypothetical protein [Symploca sp. SIO2C1]
MSQIHFYLDEDSVEKSLVAAFRNAGLDVVTVTEVNQLVFLSAYIERV